MGLFGPSKKAQQQQEQRAIAARQQEIRNLEYTIEQTRGYIAKSEKNLAEARAEGDTRREAACRRVLDTWNDGLTRDLTRLNKIR